MPSTNREGNTPPSDSAGSLVDGPDTQDCSKHAGGWGRGMNDYEYIWYGNKSEDDYPAYVTLREDFHKAILLLPEIERHLRIIAEKGKLTKSQIDKIKKIV